MDPQQYRTESDLLGTKQIPADSLTGIHTARALENFGQAGGLVHPRLIRAYGLVKLACVNTNRDLGFIDGEKAAVIAQAAGELASAALTAPAPAALQGGAGTSTNMFVNEVIANRALAIAGRVAGDYGFTSPLDHVNLHQSTNDTYPTALRVAAITACAELEGQVSLLTNSFQQKEKAFAGVVRLARTQLQDAVLTTMGRQMSAYAEAMSKDRWRIYKCGERLRVVNLGGTAIGSGLGAPTNFIFRATEELRKITSLPLARAENLVAATQNADDFVEVSGILKALASNLVKVSSDLRLLSSGPAGGFGELKLPPRQAGSSIMPGKINPVIAEFAGMCGLQAISRDTAITLAASAGQLELNAFLPLIAHNLLSMIEELALGCEKLRTMLMADLQADAQNCARHIESSTAVITAFVPLLGYEKAGQVAKMAAEQHKTIKEVLVESGLCSEADYTRITSPAAVTALGFRPGD